MAGKRDQFDKIKSSFERNKIYKSVPDRVASLTCKGDQESLFSFTPTAFVEGEGLEGQIQTGEYMPKNADTVIANFVIDEDKYFFQTQIWFKEGRVLLASSENLFLLQRRAHLRIDLDDDIQRSLNVIKHNDRTVFVDGECSDIGGGGAKITLFNDMIKVKSGDRLKVSFHIRNKWNFEAEGTVRYYKALDNGEQQFGFEFDLTNRGLVSKLQMMMLELQRLSIGLGNKKGPS